MDFEKYKSKLPRSISREMEATYNRTILELDDQPLTVSDRLEKIKAIKEEMVNHNKEIIIAHSIDQVRLNEEFNKDCEEHFGFDHLPLELKDRIHYIAYERGHSGGYSSTFEEYGDIVDIVKFAYEIGNKTK